VKPVHNEFYKTAENMSYSGILVSSNSSKNPMDQKKNFLSYKEVLSNQGGLLFSSIFSNSPTKKLPVFKINLGQIMFFEILMQSVLAPQALFSRVF